MNSPFPTKLSLPTSCGAGGSQAVGVSTGQRGRHDNKRSRCVWTYTRQRRRDEDVEALCPDCRGHQDPWPDPDSLSRGSRAIPWNARGGTVSPIATATGEVRLREIAPRTSSAPGSTRSDTLPESARSSRDRAYDMHYVVPVPPPSPRWWWCRTERRRLSLRFVRELLIRPARIRRTSRGTDIRGETRGPCDGRPQFDSRRANDRSGSIREWSRSRSNQSERRRDFHLRRPRGSGTSTTAAITCASVKYGPP